MPRTIEMLDEEVESPRKQVVLVTFVAVRGILDQLEIGSDVNKWKIPAFDHNGRWEGNRIYTNSDDYMAVAEKLGLDCYNTMVRLADEGKEQ